MHHLRLLLVPALILSTQLAQAASDLVVKPSHHDVETTVDRLEALVKKKGMTVFARIDHRANAKGVGRDMPEAQVLIFGNPDLGTRIMLHDVRAGLDLPLRVLVYQDFGGKTWVVYHNPQGLKQQYAVDKCVAIEKAEKGLARLTDAAAGE